MEHAQLTMPRLVDAPTGEQFILNGKILEVGDERPSPASWRGFGGSCYVIRTNDGRRFISTNMWYTGMSTEPDTAVFERHLGSGSNAKELAQEWIASQQAGK